MSEIAPSLLAVLLVVYLPPAVVLSWADGREHRLPNRWVGILTGGVAAALLVLSLIQPGLRAEVRVAAVLALVLGFGAVLVAVLMSAALGGEVLIAALLGIALLSGVLGMVVIAVTRRAGVRFALGPVLLAGPFLGLLGAPLVRAALGTG